MGRHLFVLVVSPISNVKTISLGQKSEIHNPDLPNVDDGGRGRGTDLNSSKLKVWLN